MKGQGQESVCWTMGPGISGKKSGEGTNERAMEWDK